MFDVHTTHYWKALMLFLKKIQKICKFAKSSCKVKRGTENRWNIRYSEDTTETKLTALFKNVDKN